MAYPSYTYTIANGSLASGSYVMQNFNDVLNGISDGTKDIKVKNLETTGLVTMGLQDSTCFFHDNSDATKKLAFECSSITTGTTRTWTVPNFSDVLVGRDGQQSLTTKGLEDSSCYFYDNGDATKRFAFQCSGITTGTTRTVTIPNASGTMLLGETPNYVVGTPATSNSGAFNNASYVTPTNSPSASITPTVTGTFKISCSFAWQADSTSSTPFFKIIASSGSPTVVFSQIAVFNNAVATKDTMGYVYMIATLTASTAYTFTLQAKCGTGNLNMVNGDLDNGCAILIERLA